MTIARPDDAFAAIPDPGRVRTLAELIGALRSLKVWAGDPSYEWITSQINNAWTAAGRPAAELTKRPTVVDCFKLGRRRLNTDLVIAIVQALHPDVGYVTQWRQALRVIGGETRAAAQVRVQDSLPQDLAGFTGRTAELDRLRQALHHAQHAGDAVVISAIAGMAGVGKTQLAIHIGHLLSREMPFDRVLFVNLRGFHPDPAQPPADPAAVLDGFLRLLGVPGQQIPHNLHARTATYRSRLADTHTLVVLDNAANEDQVRPLLPDTPGCLTLITSRRSLTDLHPATHLDVDVFTADEAVTLLTHAASHVPIGQDPNAAARIARRCGYLPLALGLVTGHIRSTPGWTLTDHADRLDERHHQRRLDTGVELALDLSYQHLAGDQQRLLRLAALHPGQDLDAYAAAALADTNLPTAHARLDHLCGDHWLQQGIRRRYTFHDLVRSYAINRASDEDPPPQRRAALTRLFDYYLATAADAMDALYPAETHLRPHIPPAGTPSPTFTDPDTARAWLDVERPALVTMAAYTATHSWSAHSTRVSTILFRYLDSGHHTDALMAHTHACQAAHDTGDPTGQGHALVHLGITQFRLGRYNLAGQHFQQALTLFQQADDQVGQARALTDLGSVEERVGCYRPAADHHEQALALFRQTGDRIGEANALTNLGNVEERLGRYVPAADHHKQASVLFRQTGDRIGEANALNNRGYAEVQLGHYGWAADHLREALALFRRHGDRTGEAWTLNSLGTLQTRLNQPAPATEHYQQALTIVRETGDRDGEAWALNGLGEATRAAGRPTDALTLHSAAHTIATHTGARDQHARAHTGLGHAHHTLGNLADARLHYQHALTLYTDLGTSDADQIRAHITTVDNNGPVQRQ